MRCGCWRKFDAYQRIIWVSGIFQILLTRSCGVGYKGLTSFPAFWPLRVESGSRNGLDRKKSRSGSDTKSGYDRIRDPGWHTDLPIQPDPFKHGTAIVLYCFRIHDDSMFSNTWWFSPANKSKAGIFWRQSNLLYIFLLSVEICIKSLLQFQYRAKIRLFSKTDLEAFETSRLDQ